MPTTPTRKIIELPYPQQVFLSSLAEGTITNVFDKALYDNGLTYSNGLLTDRGLAYAVGYCNALMSKRFAMMPKARKRWAEMLANIEPYVNGNEELDMYFKANMQAYIEHDLFKPNGSFVTGLELSTSQHKALRLTCIEKFLYLNKYADSTMRSIMELARRQLLSQKETDA